MSRLKDLIREIHRRSLWQVLLIYIGAAWACFELIDTVTDRLGLPVWLPGLAIVLFLVALPAVVATAFLKEGESASVVSDPTLIPVGEADSAAQRARRLLTWRNAGLSFVGVLAVWGVVAAGWLLIGERPAPKAVNARKSIAVLPFDNIGDLEENVEFTDGIHDDIIGTLQKIGDLKPISRTSVLGYRDTNKNLRDIAAELGVAYVLEGSVQRSGNRIRMRAQLIDAETDEHLWADTYEEDLTAENIFTIQTDIAQRIASSLKAQLTPEESERIAARPTENLQAYELYQAARQYNHRNEEPLIRVQVRMYEEAIELDPGFALAHAALSSRYSYLYRNHGRDEADLSKAKVHADRALELDPGLAAAHRALGAYYYFGFLDYERALEQLVVARELAPQDAAVFHMIHMIQRRMGDFEAGLANGKKAVELDPRQVGSVEELPTTLLWMRQFEGAISLYDRAIALDPARYFSYGWKAWAYLNTEGGAGKARQVLEGAERVRGRIEADNSQSFQGRARLRILHDRYKDRLRQYTLETYSGDTLTYYRGKALSYSVTKETGLARAYFDSARVVLEGREVQSPEYHHSNLGVIYAGLGRVDDAMREGKLAVEALPTSRDAVTGPFIVATLAEIYVMVGDYEAAIDQLEQVLSLTCPISPPLLRADPIWDPLRDHPRFQALLAKYE